MKLLVFVACLVSTILSSAAFAGTFCDSAVEQVRTKGFIGKITFKATNVIDATDTSTHEIEFSLVPSIDFNSVRCNQDKSASFILERKGKFEVGGHQYPVVVVHHLYESGWFFVTKSGWNEPPTYGFWITEGTDGVYVRPEVAQALVGAHGYSDVSVKGAFELEGKQMIFLFVEDKLPTSLFPYGFKGEAKKNGAVYEIEQIGQRLEMAP